MSCREHIARVIVHYHFPPKIHAKEASFLATRRVASQGAFTGDVHWPRLEYRFEGTRLDNASGCEPIERHAKCLTQWRAQLFNRRTKKSAKGIGGNNC